MSVHLKSEHLKRAQQLVAEMHAQGGLAPVDLERFWVADAIARQDPFSESCPQVALGIAMAPDCIFAELGIEENADTLYRLHRDPDWAAPHLKAYNDKAEAIVGRRLLDETPPADPESAYPAVKDLAELFEGVHQWHGNSWWLQQAVHDAEGLKRLLDGVESRLENLRAFLLPPGWDEQRERLFSLGIKPPLYRQQRGPVTFATSICGPENFLYLFYDAPELVVRFRDVILRAMLEIGRILDKEAGYTLETAPRGFMFADDNCCLLTPDMYELFGYPILKAVFERYAPDPTDYRGQHSDSDMQHLLPILSRLGLTWANFGPNIMVDEIRQFLPRAIIQGQLAPFTFSRGEEVNMVAEFLRDFERARAQRGLVFDTAGAVNNGSRLTGMRLIMAAIQRFGQYGG